MSQRGRYATAAVVAVVLAGVGTSTSCTPRPPEIRRVDAELRIVTDRQIDREYEQLALFVEVSDPEGFDDVDEVVLLHDPSELVWRIDRNAWAVIRDNEWVGSAALTMADLGPFPRGSYRLLLYDAGGNRAEEWVSVEGPSAAAAEPEVKLTETTLTVGGTRRVIVQLVDGQGRTLTQKMIGPGSYPFEQLADGAQVPVDLRVYLRVEEPSNAARLPRIVGPFFR